jgi:uncharacterized protein YdeI (YjbR/CyaY-like superfamily)
MLKIGDESMDTLFFKDHIAFWNWLNNHCHDEIGYWIKFDKKRQASTLTYEQALDVALCFGWIDGQTKRLDDTYYLKYFTRRRKSSIWSTKNKISVTRLINEGSMMPSGMYEVDRAKLDGRWDKADMPPEDFSVESFQSLLNDNPVALKNFLAFSASIQKTYAMSYYALKKNESRDNRLKIIMDRLEKKLKPME